MSRVNFLLVAMASSVNLCSVHIQHLWPLWPSEYWTSLPFAGMGIINIS